MNSKNHTAHGSPMGRLSTRSSLVCLVLSRRVESAARILRRSLGGLGNARFGLHGGDRAITRAHGKRTADRQRQSLTGKRREARGGP